MGKKLTRKEKEELSKKNICWKCKKPILITKNGIKCPHCGFERKNI